jgi:hypothetical protein
MEKTIILKRIGAISKGAAKLVKDIQEVAVACAVHAVQHGDVTLADQLVDAVSKGMRRNSLRAWFELKAPMYLPKGKDKFAFDAERAKALKALSNDELVAQLDSLKWEDAKPEAAVVSVFDVSEAVDKFMKRIESMVNDANVTVRNKELLEVLGQQVAIYHAEKVLNQRIDTPAA